MTTVNSWSIGRLMRRRPTIDFLIGRSAGGIRCGGSLGGSSSPCVYPSSVCTRWYSNHRLDTTANRGVEAVSRLRKFDDRVFIFANDRLLPRSLPLRNPVNASRDSRLHCHRMIPQSWSCTYDCNLQLRIYNTIACRICSYTCIV